MLRVVFAVALLLTFASAFPAAKPGKKFTELREATAKADKQGEGVDLLQCAVPLTLDCRVVFCSPWAPYVPVCSTKNVTYVNNCAAQCFYGQTVECYGECPCDCDPRPTDCRPQCDNPVNCFVDPCAFSTPCEAQRGLTCVSDYCGGCNARYYDDKCNEVKCTDTAL